MWTQADIDALRRAIATGAKRVEYGDKIVEYRTLAEMERTLALMEEQVNGAQSFASRRKVLLMDRGFNKFNYLENREDDGHCR